MVAVRVTDHNCHIADSAHVDLAVAHRFRAHVHVTMEMTSLRPETTYYAFSCYSLIPQIFPSQESYLFPLSCFIMLQKFYEIV